MGKFTLRIDERVLNLQTTPGSARIYVRVADGQDFIFDPDLDRYLSEDGGSKFDPYALGLDPALLTTKLHEAVRQRRLEIQKINDDPFESGERVKLFDNGDFRYFVPWTRFDLWRAVTHWRFRVSGTHQRARKKSSSDSGPV